LADPITHQSEVGTTSCVPINTDGQQPDYFKNNNTNAPLDQWDFNNIWRTEATDYPTFVGSSGPVEPEDTAPTAPRNLSISNRTTSSMRLHCQAPTSDGGSALTGYRIQY